MCEKKEKQIERNNPYLRRAILYLPISLMSIIYGIIHASKLLEIPMQSIDWGITALLVISLLINALLFLVVYTQVFRGSEELPSPPVKQGTINTIGYVSCLQMIFLVFIANGYSLSYALILVCHYVVTIISCTLMNKKAIGWVEKIKEQKRENIKEGDKKSILQERKVRLELIWPSIYNVALGIVCGFFIIACRNLPIDKSAVIQIVIPMGAVALYSIFMFSVEDKKRKGKETLHPLHIGSLIFLCVTAFFKDSLRIQLSNGNNIFPFKYFGLLFWAVLIAAVFALFESWAVVERRNGDTNDMKRYIRSSNMVLVALVIIMPIVYMFTFLQDVSPLCLAFFAIIGVVYLYTRYAYRKKEFQPAEGFVRVIKIIFTALCIALLIICELIAREIHETIKNYLVNDVTITIKVIAALPIVGVVLGGLAVIVKWLISLFRQKTTQEKRSDIKILDLLITDKAYEETDNLFKQILYYAILGIIICGITALIVIGVAEKKGRVITHTIPAAFLYYIFIIIMCLRPIIREIREMRNKHNDEADEINSASLKNGTEESKKSNNIANNKFLKKLSKISELLHIPSSLMIMVLILLPSLLNGVDWSIAILRSLPLTLIAMAGFALNNFIDADKDKINKPNRAIPSGVFSKRLVLQMSVFLYLLASVIVLLSTKNLFEITVYIVALLGTIFYSILSKKIGYIKTLITGLLTTAPFVIVIYYYKPDINAALFLSGVVLSTIGKELLMDIRDIRGDHFVGQNTIATMFGKVKTQFLSIGISIVAIIFYLLSYRYELYIGIIISIAALILLLCSYAIWFSNKSNKKEIGIYLLWGVIIICGLPVLI